MFPDSVIDAGLVQAFRDTHYRAHGAEPFTLRVDEHSVKLAAAHIEGIGQHSSNRWPGEASYLVFGLKLEPAKTLGRALKQNAIVWSDADAVPRLLLLR